MTTMRDVDAVILAGGMGTRLRPYTFSIPKPLIRLGDLPIIEILLCQLEAAGVRRVHVALGHLADLVQAYLEQTEWRSRLEIRYSLESQPLGTVGPLTLIDDLSETVLLVNGDVLTTLPYAALVDDHRSRGGLATVAVSRRQVELRYGILELSSDARVTGYREKPLLELDTAMGVYALQRAVVDHIPPGRRFDMPELIQSLIGAGEPIAAYPSDDYWMDIGSTDDYEVAQRDFAAAPQRFLRPSHPTRRARAVGA